MVREARFAIMGGSIADVVHGNNPNPPITILVTGREAQIVQMLNA